ncbi:sensor histidine kinase [Neomoorella thermoacetica]|uniref:sensor histidine kinase n=1 Tax=Neomoorella thermoacetica TaxID=1525 RepID=UPI0008FBB366|nr:GHKL domain-containing protein [Moorella thermoacetica]APC08818.1 sensor histidine kinase DcuS [Moorella thermoacetica]
MGRQITDYWMLIILLGQTFLLNIAVQNLQLSPYAGIQPITLGANLVSLSFYFMTLLLIKKLLDIKEQQKLLVQKEKEMDSLQNLLRTVRAQRHDIINHLDTVYALLSLGREVPAREYTGQLVQVAANTSHLLRLEQPVVAAFLQNKASQAMARGITFYIDVRADLKGLKVKPYALVTVLGNILENAMEAVEPLPGEQRLIQLDISRSEAGYIFSISNSGPPLDSAMKEAIFRPGVSTKGPDRGLGLATVWEMVISHGGTIEVETDPVTFRVKFPV